MSYWQHDNPLLCPKKHKMGWLGTAYWICEKCHLIYVQMAPREECVAASKGEK